MTTILKNKTYSFLLALFLISKIALSTHVVGGEIYYDYLGGNNYKIHMKVYRDCLNGVPPFDDPAFFTVFGAGGNVVTTLQVSVTSTITVPPTNNSPCAPSEEGNACVEEAIYETIINLPPISGGYYIAYQRCCRNHTILNVVDPGNVGATYWEHIPGPEDAVINSSPRFVKRPPIYICAGTPIAFDHSAIDPDGDSLVYTLCTPFNGLGPPCPVIDANNSNCPFPLANTPPPYVSVPFAAPFSASYPMSSSPAININPVTGFLDGVPDMQGQWVVGVCVDEYRNGVLIATHHRDFQFNVIACPFVVAADIVSQTTTNNGAGTGFCNGFTISYHNNSFNGSTYFWDFGDPNSTTDTSTAYNPTYTFPSQGTYTVTLYVNPNSPCGDTTTEVFEIHPLLSPDFIEPQGQCLTGNDYDFVGGGLFQGNGTFNWNFGSGASPQTASTLNVNDVTYSTYGVKTVTFTVNENGCTASSTSTIEVYQNPQASIAPFNANGCSPQSVSFQNLSTAGTGMTFIWNFSDGTSSTAVNPFHTFVQPGVYSVSLTVMTNQKCIDTNIVSAINSITVNPTPSAAFTATTSGFCLDNNNGNFACSPNFQGSTGVLNWNFSSNATPQSATTPIVNNVVFNNAGTYTVSLVANEFGCKDSTTQVFVLYENPVALVDTYNVAGCDPQSISFTSISTAASGMGYLWSFSDGFTSTEQNPTHTFSPPGIYTFTFSVHTAQNCVDTSNFYSVHSITVSPSPVANFTATPIITSIFDPDINFSSFASSDANTWYYDFADGSGSNLSNPMHTYSTWGDYLVTQTVVNSFGCPNTASVLVKILPEFRFWVPNAFTPGNHDFTNDVFKPVVIGVEEYTFTIFNRWGELIYSTDDTDAGWDGTYKGKASPLDVYVWKCDFKNVVSKSREYHIGHVTLVR